MKKRLDKCGAKPINLRKLCKENYGYITGDDYGHYGVIIIPKNVKNIMGVSLSEMLKSSKKCLKVLK